MATGVLTAYDLTTGVIVDMDEAIYLISPTDSPMIAGTGADGLSVLSVEDTDEKKVEWMDEDILTPRTTLSAQVVTATTVLTVPAGDELKFVSGDIIMVGAHAEYVQVTNAAIVSGQITVTRAFAGTATTIVTSTALVGVGSALPEGSDPGTARAKDRTGRYNVTQIFGPTKISMSRTEARVAKYGVADEWSKQLMNRIAENVIMREQAILYGQLTENSGTKIRTMGGLYYWINSLGNMDSSTTSLTPLAIQTMQQTCYNKGAVPDRGMGNPTQTKNLTDVNTLTTIHESRDVTQRGREPATYVDTEFGRLTIVRNRWVINSDFFMFRRETTKRRVLDPLQFEWLAKTGDSKNGQIVCEESLEVKGAQHMGMFTALT